MRNPRLLINVSPTSPAELESWARARPEYPALSMLCCAKRVVPHDRIGLCNGSSLSIPSDYRVFVERLLGRSLQEGESFVQSTAGSRRKGRPIPRAWWND